MKKHSECLVHWKATGGKPTVAIVVSTLDQRLHASHYHCHHHHECFLSDNVSLKHQLIREAKETITSNDMGADALQWYKLHLYSSHCIVAMVCWKGAEASKPLKPDYGCTIARLIVAQWCRARYDRLQVWRQSGIFLACCSSLRQTRASKHRGHKD